MKNIGVYIRKSKDSENQKSLKEQQLLGTEFCKEHGYNAIMYNDGIVSGAGDTDKRPQYNQMLTDISKGKLYGIYIWNTDRTARDEIAWHTLANLLKKHNVFLFDNGNKADFSDENTLLFYTIKSGMDAYFSRVTSTKIKTVLKRNAKEGKFGGLLKYGYARDKNGVTIINPNEADTVKLIFQMCIEGKGFTAIAGYLNNNNIPTRYNQLRGDYKKDSNLHGKNDKVTTKSKKDAKWVNKVVGNILRSRWYVGEKVYNGQILEVPQIISLSTFKKAQDRIDKRLNKHGKQSFKKYLLNDILICAKCGKRYTGRQIKNHLYYRCASRIIKGGSCGSSGIKLAYLDKVIWDYFFQDKYLLQTLYNNIKEGETSTNKDVLIETIKGLNTNLKTKEKQLNNVTKYLIEGTIKENEAKTQLTRLRSEIADTLLKIERETENLTNLNNIDKQIKDYQTEIGNLHHHTPFDEKKRIIEKHLEEINIINTDGYFTVNLKFKSFNHSERFIIDKEYSPPSIVDIETDNELRANGHKNLMAYLEQVEIPKIDGKGVKIYDLDGNLE